MPVSSPEKCSSLSTSWTKDPGSVRWLPEVVGAGGSSAAVRSAASRASSASTRVIMVGSPRAGGHAPAGRSPRPHETAVARRARRRTTAARRDTRVAPGGAGLCCKRLAPRRWTRRASRARTADRPRLRRRARGCFAPARGRVAVAAPAGTRRPPSRHSPRVSTRNTDCSARRPRSTSSASACSNCARAAARWPSACSTVPSVLCTAGESGA